MRFEAGKIYHIYNRSNEIAFHNRDNYLYFLKKINQFVSPKCEILAWCLMPNHFHLLIKATPQSEILIEDSYRERTQELAKAIGSLLSSYTQG